MHWIAPPEKDKEKGSLKKRLWEAADQFRANSGLSAAQDSLPQRRDSGRRHQDSAIVAPSFRLTYELHLQIQNLHRTRDLLLPRLLLGQVELKTEEVRK